MVIWGQRLWLMLEGSGGIRIQFWWRDLMSIEDGLSQHKDLFQETYRCEVGDGSSILFLVSLLVW